MSTTSRAAWRFSTSGESAGGILSRRVVQGALFSVWQMALLIRIGEVVVVLPRRDRRGYALVFGKAEGVSGDW